MKLLVAPDSSMYKTPDGKYWCPTIYEYSFFERYLQVFEEIVVASRVKDASYDEVKGFLRCDGKNMTVSELPDMHGMKDYINKLIPFAKSAKKAITGVDCAIFRVPSVPASMILHYYKKTKKKCFLEVVVDPEDAYASNIIAKYLFTRLLKKQCLTADGVSYVTKQYLQRKYPSYRRKNGKDGKHFETYYSTIRLNDSYFGKPRKYIGKNRFVIIHTANNMNNNVKGHIELLYAAKIVIAKGYDILVKFVGDGSLREHLEQKADELEIKDRVIFVGRLAGSDLVRNELLNADLLVFPTKAEGLPRTVIEAMAVGLPVISTPVAGIPELLDKEDMIHPTNVKGFAQRIIYLLNHPEELEIKSAKNIKKASNYSEHALSKKRNVYYSALKRLAAQDYRE